ncbi:MAG: EamA family transporter RarD [Acidobacteria bacterium]|nr:MAG: EamA family transporter RarD [Acidobacteriota bacterium]
MPSSRQTKGAWYVGLAYAFWGFFPIYWKALVGISSLQLICHRIVWSFLMLIMLIARSKDWSALWQAVRTPRVLAVYTVASFAIAVNWLIFVWAVGVNQIVQISLGYFINPLLSVVLGMVVFHERLRRLQWISVALAAAGVLYLTFALQTLPWIALSLAATFGTYGLMKKVAPLGPVQGLALETGILFVPAAVYLIVEELAGRGAFMHSGPLGNALMLAAGPITTLPLLMFAAGVRHIPLSLVGMLQYVNPTLQISIGVLLYHEPFTRIQLIGFSLVWSALALFAIEGYLTRRWPQLGVTDVS